MKSCNSAICTSCPTVQKGGPGWLCPPLICLRQALLLPPLGSESLHHRSIFLFPSLQPECVAAHVHLWLVHSMLGQKVNMKLDVHTKFCFKYILHTRFYIECYFVAEMPGQKNLEKIKFFLAAGPLHVSTIFQRVVLFYNCPLKYCVCIFFNDCMLHLVFSNVFPGCFPFYHAINCSVAAKED